MHNIVRIHFSSYYTFIEYQNATQLQWHGLKLECFNKLAVVAKLVNR